MVKQCTADNCPKLTRKNRTTNYCPMHDRRLKLYGDPLKGKRAAYTGRSTTPGYSSWLAAKQRCYNKNDKKYEHYGGRGIKMCDRWLNSAQAFLNDMGERPKGMTLERIDVNGNYEPSNCKWATWDEQRRNKRPYTYRHKYTHCGKGHEWTPKNTGLNHKGGRWCRACSKIHDNERREQRRKIKQEANRQAKAIH